MNRFTQQKPISKSVLSILVPVVVFFAVFFLVSSSCLFYLSYYKTRRNRELKTRLLSAVPFTVMPWKELIRKVLSYLENHYGITYDHSK